MLSGSRDIEFPVYFNSTYGQFSDDGTTMWDAYGHRWREFFGWDQLEAIVEELRVNPASRRCVLAMWNAEVGDDTEFMFEARSGVRYHDDLGVACNGGKAVPCNTHAYFAIRAGKLNLTVMNRSNDTIWGAFGANAVHFTLLLEYMAMRIGVPMGSYYLFTNNLHVYTDKFDHDKLGKMADESAEALDVDYGPAITEGFDADLKLFMPWALSIIRAEAPPASWPMNHPPHYATELAIAVPDLQTPFMWSVVVPTFLFWVFRKWKDDYSSNSCLDGIDAPDWQQAIEQWKERRETKKTKA